MMLKKKKKNKKHDVSLVFFLLMENIIVLFLLYFIINYHWIINGMKKNASLAYIFKASYWIDHNQKCQKINIINNDHTLKFEK